MLTGLINTTQLFFFPKLLSHIVQDKKTVQQWTDMLIKYSLDPNCSKLSPLDQFPQFCSQGKIKPITKCSFHTLQPTTKIPDAQFIAQSKDILKNSRLWLP